MSESPYVAPASLLAALGGRQDEVLSGDGTLAATAALDALAELPLLSSSLGLRSHWLKYVREVIVDLGDHCPDSIEIRMLAAISRAALLAHQTSPGLATAEHALNRATESGDVYGQLLVLAGRLPMLAHKAPVEANRDLRQIEADWQDLVAARGQRLSDDDLWLQGELLLARLSYHAATGDMALMRVELAELGRVPLPRRPALSFVAYASQALLLQMWLREGHYERAERAADDAIELCDQESAWVEVANVCAIRAALALLAGRVRQAVDVARRGVAAAARTPVQDQQPDPWLGLPFDVCPGKTPAQAIQLMAEAVLTAQDQSDATAFLVAALAMGAYYLADDRALEALDALNEASQVAKALADPTPARLVRHAAEQLLGYLGILRR